MIRRTPTSTRAAPTGRPTPARPCPPAGLRPGHWRRRAAWAAGFLVLTAGLLWLLWPVFTILVAAAGLAYILDPLVDRFEDRGFSREFGIAVLLAIFVALAAVILLLLVPPLLRKLAAIGLLLRDFFAALDTRVAPLAAWIDETTGYAIPLDVDSLQQRVPSWIEKVLPKIQGTLSEAVQSLFTRGLGMINAVLNLTLLPLFSFYLLRDWDRMVAGMGELVPPVLRPRIFRVAREVDSRLSAFVRGQLTVCAVLGLLYSVGLWVAGIDLPWSIGLLSGALFIIPYLGTLVGILLASLLAVVEYGVDLHLLWVLLVFGTVQAIEGYLLTPKVVGDRVGLHPLVVIIALIVGGSLLGIWGMLLAIPVTATMSVLAAEWLQIYRASSLFQDRAP